MDSVIRRIERARAEGLNVTADMYTYIAGGTGLTATMPPTLAGWWFWKTKRTITGSRYPSADDQRHEYKNGPMGKFLLWLLANLKIFWWSDSSRTA